MLRQHRSRVMYRFLKRSLLAITFRIQMMVKHNVHMIWIAMRKPLVNWVPVRGITRSDVTRYRIQSDTEGVITSDQTSNPQNTPHVSPSGKRTDVFSRKLQGLYRAALYQVKMLEWQYQKVDAWTKWLPFADNFFQWISFERYVWIFIQISFKFFLIVQLIMIRHCFRSSHNLNRWWPRYMTPWIYLLPQQYFSTLWLGTHQGPFY